MNLTNNEFYAKEIPYQTKKKNALHHQVSDDAEHS